MSLSRINLVVVGHKDHGKSTLIGRLLYDSNAIPEAKMQEVEAELKKAGDEGFRFAFLLDTFEEERRGGLTIDIMQTPFETKKHIYTIIDCPGHREFIKKMLTGASQADAAILVVSTKEGIQDQTMQHAFLIKTLGIQQLIVVVNKMDDANYKEENFKKIRDSLQQMLGSLGYVNPPILPISALNGENVFRKSEKMQWYKGPSLIDTLDAEITPLRLLTDKPLRGCVQDIYGVENQQMIICRILTGVLERGQTIRFDPSGKTGRVQKIDMFGKELEIAKPGDSVGILLDSATETRRGDVISLLPDRATVPESFVAEIILFQGFEMKNGDIIAIRCGTAETKCRVQNILEKIDPINLTLSTKSPESLEGGDVGKVVLSPVEPVCVEKYSDFPELGRFVVEGGKGTEAAGIVLETRTT